MTVDEICLPVSLSNERRWADIVDDDDKVQQQATIAGMLMALDKSECGKSSVSLLETCSNVSSAMSSMEGCMTSTSSESSHSMGLRAARQPPKTRNFALHYEMSGVNQDAITTLMFRRLPANLTQKALVKKLKEIDLDGSFDFLHVPVEPRSMRNIGFAFVNFVDVASAQKCMVDLPAGCAMRGGKPLEVGVAHLQGFDANVKHYETTVVGKSSLRRRRPLILPKGVVAKLDEDDSSLDIQ